MEGGRMKERFRINILSIIVISVIFVSTAHSLIIAEETLTVTTYYPSPYGSYHNLTTTEFTTTGNTTLASGSGAVILGNVAPGTAKLAVNGTVLIDSGGTAGRAVCWKSDNTLGSCIISNSTGECVGAPPTCN
jgi:hypothetical protein